MLHPHSPVQTQTAASKHSTPSSQKTHTELPAVAFTPASTLAPVAAAAATSNTQSVSNSTVTATPQPAVQMDNKLQSAGSSDKSSKSITQPIINQVKSTIALPSLSHKK